MKRYLHSLLVAACVFVVGTVHSHAQDADEAIPGEAEAIKDSARVGVILSRQWRSLMQRDFKAFADAFAADGRFEDATERSGRKLSKDELVSLVRKDCSQGAVTKVFMLFGIAHNSDTSHPYSEQKHSHQSICYLTLKTPRREMLLIAYYLEQYVRPAAGKIVSTRLCGRHVSNLGSYARPNYLLGLWRYKGISVNGYDTVEFFPDGTVHFSARNGNSVTGSYRRIAKDTLRLDLRGFVPRSDVATVTLLPSADYRPSQYKWDYKVGEYQLKRLARLRKGILAGVKASGGYPELLYPVLGFYDWTPEEMWDGAVKSPFPSALLIKESKAEYPDYFQR